jgi:hypothetical protein
MSHKYPCIYYDNGKCQKFSDEKYNSWCDFDQCEHIAPSNGDRIRAMSDEELAELLSKPWCENHRFKEECARFDTDCEACVLDWLCKPAEEDT